MKTLRQIYDSILNRFNKKTKLDIYPGSVIDKFTISVSSGIEEVYEEIERNKNPHIYTNLKGSDIDSCGILVGCSRQENEDDQNYLYRMINWNTNNQTSNYTAIENALINLKYSSNAQFYPYTQGVGTGTIYIIPKSLDIDTIDNAIKEVKDNVEPIKGATSYITYVVPKILKVDVIVLYNAYKNIDECKNNIHDKFETYINSIPPGEYLNFGELNKLGNDEVNISYLQIGDVIIDGKQLKTLKQIQTIDKKFVLGDITWEEVID